MRLIPWGAAVLAAGLVLPADARGQEPQYVSASGRKYFALPDDKNVVAEAEKKAAAAPPTVESLAALGDAYATVWDHRKAIEVYDRGFRIAPDSALLHQQRGHRRLSIRQFEAARADLEKAVALDPKLAGAWYYLGVLRYLAGEFDGAAEAFERNVALAEKVEAGIGGLDWLHMSYARAGQAEKARVVLARVTPDLKIEGNPRLYFNRMLFYKGLKTEAALFEGTPSEIERATLAYGIGNWHLVKGDPAKARTYFEQVVATTAWPALAFIAAERDLARMSAR